MKLVFLPALLAVTAVAAAPTLLPAIDNAILKRQGASAGADFGFGGEVSVGAGFGGEAGQVAGGNAGGAGGQGGFGIGFNIGAGGGGDGGAGAGGA
ncbi:hypothetical protein PTNB73_01536 [Pyrenophora teres f. teres]|uniref:Uncharacterized protein n=1 Tax=Pyrenophora teres f. teres TaxID=97479 RepID=A0A6S6VZN5_9PLEO|nr:hypothetical protein PTNB85_01533 [Pyrenophora teres f. teres]KAE8854153.1 hypothetical protein HRS9122_01145 [Pyrenophora teres f. teres]KAE8867617.1 hypothetical protein PTNB29_01528 [Pyrenophora teres f. teres]KAE8872385.1 hypothetical protein PTNB73_01536 [Pyrenophora teres f. teres]CAE7027796.1 hypothetical protein PTTW11_04308 [Pyrenophora teres f. teres]